VIYRQNKSWLTQPQGVRQYDKLCFSRTLRITVNVSKSCEWRDVIHIYL